MPDLTFSVEDAKPVPHAAAPLLSFRLRIQEKGERPTSIQNIALRCQVRIESTRRRYNMAEQERLVDLFGEPSRWSQTLQAMLWTHTQLTVPPFIGSTTVELPVPCSYDFNVAATKYFYGLDEGEIPLILLFSGTIFLTGPRGGLQIEQISWEKETTYRLSVSVWKAMIEEYYPNSAWLRLRRDVFDRLYRYKSRYALPTCESALERLLRTGEEGATP